MQTFVLLLALVGATTAVRRHARDALSSLTTRSLTVEDLPEPILTGGCRERFPGKAFGALPMCEHKYKKTLSRYDAPKMTDEELRTLSAALSETPEKVEATYAFLKKQHLTSCAQVDRNKKIGERCGGYAQKSMVREHPPAPAKSVLRPKYTPCSKGRGNNCESRTGGTFSSAAEECAMEKKPWFVCISPDAHFASNDEDETREVNVIRTTRALKFARVRCDSWYRFGSAYEASLFRRLTKNNAALVTSFVAKYKQNEYECSYVDDEAYGSLSGLSGRPRETLTELVGKGGGSTHYLTEYGVCAGEVKEYQPRHMSFAKAQTLHESLTQELGAVVEEFQHVKGPLTWAARKHMVSTTTAVQEKIQSFFEEVLAEYQQCKAALESKKRA